MSNDSKPNGGRNRKTLSIIQHIFDFGLGGHISNPRRKDDLINKIQENRLNSMTHRHQFEMHGSAVPYTLVAFPEKGILITANENGLDMMYIEEPQSATSNRLIKPVSWTIKDASCGKFLAFGNSKIEDICSKAVEAGTDDDKRDYFLAVTNGWMCGMACLKLIPAPRTSASPITSRSLLPITLGTYQFPKRAIWSCDYSPVKKDLAFGGEKFASLDGLERRHRRTTALPGNILSVTFNGNGNVLYCGSHNGTVHFLDLRAGLRPIGKFRVQPGVQKMALLTDDEKLLVSCFEHSLAQVDLRVNRAPFYYPEHCNHDLKIPFSFCEVNDVLCSAGQDEIIRFWSLKSGSFLYYLQPNNGYQPHAWYAENWNSYSSRRTVGVAAGVTVVTGPSVYLMDL